MPLKKMHTADHISFWVFKIIYYSLFIVVPIITIGFTNWLIGFFMLYCGHWFYIKYCVSARSHS